MGRNGSGGSLSGAQPIPGSVGSGGGAMAGSVGSSGFSGAGSMDRSRNSGVLSSSLSGRLRSVSDLERSGLVTPGEKGRLKDLIISGDESLRAALEKYESGDTTALENLIARGHLSDTPGLSAGFDASELDTDLGSLGLDSNDFLGMFDNDRNQLVGNANSGGNRRGDSLGWDYDFGLGNSGEPFEMDDLGMDSSLGISLGSGGLGGDILAPPNSGSGHPQAAVPSAPSNASGHPSGHATRRAGQHGGGHKTRSGGGSVATQAAHASAGSHSGTAARRAPASVAPPQITSQGTVNFPNSTDSGSRFPVSNCVAELPPLLTLPPGQAPAYEALINFQRAKSKDAVRCVMCGKAPQEGESGTVIPQQNKDVCRDCDKALWVHGETRTYFKWCKGCKRFRNIVAFSEKLDASKCNGCRERGRRSYLQRKGISGDEVGPGEGQDAAGAAAVVAPAPAANDIGGGLTFNMPDFEEPSAPATGGAPAAWAEPIGLDP